MRRRSGVTDGPREAMAGSSGTCFRIDVAEFGPLTGSLSKGRLCSSLLQPRQASALAELQRGYGRNGNCSAPTWSFSLRFAMESEAEKVETFETRPRTPHRKRRQGSWRFFASRLRLSLVGDRRRENGQVRHKQAPGNLSFGKNEVDSFASFARGRENALTRKKGGYDASAGRTVAAIRR